MMKRLALTFLLAGTVAANAQKIEPAACTIVAGTITCPTGSLTPAGGTGTVTSVSVTTANGVSGSVATATTTPAISLTLGAITPTTVNGNTFTTGTGTLTLGSVTLNAGAGGTLGSNAFTSTGYMPLAGGTFSGGIGFSTTNTLDIGTNATTLAPRTVYAGTSFVGPVGTFTTSATIGAGSAITTSGAGGAMTALAYTAPGTGVATALGVNIGSAGAFVTFNGALGTPSSGVATNLTSIPVANATGILPAANGGAGTINGALKGNGSGVVSQAACADLSNGSGACAQTYTATSWTPTLSTDATAGTPAYSVQTGTYEQVGKLVVAHFAIVLSGWTGSPTGNVQINGLPVADGSNYGSCSISRWAFTGLSALNYSIAALVNPGASVAILQQSGSTGTITITAAQVGTTPTIVGNCIYNIN